MHLHIKFETAVCGLLRVWFVLGKRLIKPVALHGVGEESQVTFLVQTVFYTYVSSFMIKNIRMLRIPS